MITNWNKNTLELFRRDLDTAIKSVMTKHGLMPVSGIHMSYTANKSTVKFDAFVNPANFTAAESQFTNQEAAMLRNLGLPLGTKLKAKDGQTCTVISYNSRSRKFPIITQTPSGVQIGFGTEYAKRSVVEYPAGYVPPIQPDANGGLRRTYPLGKR